MKKTLTVLLILFIYVSSYCQNESPVTIVPQKPKYGDIVLITYDPGSQYAAIKNSDEMYMYWGILNPDSIIKMQSNNGKWSCNLSLNDSSRSYIKFAFKSEYAYDMNNGRLWDFLVYDKNGIPMKNAYFNLSRTTSIRIDRDEINVDSLAIEDLKNELFYHPDNFEAKMELYSYQIRISDRPDSIRGIAIKEMEDKYIDKLNDKKILRRFLQGVACGMGDFNKGRKIRDKLAEIDPEYKLRLDIIDAAERVNPKEKIKLMEKYTSNYSNRLQSKEYFKEIFDYYLNKNDEKNLLRTAENWIKSEKINKCEVYNTIANILADKNSHLDLALDYSEKSLDYVSNYMTGIAYMRDSDTGIVIEKREITKEDSIRQIRSITLEYKDTKGWIFYNMGKYQVARSLISEAYRVNKNSNEIGFHMASTFEKLGLPDSAFEVYKKIYINKYRDPALRKKITDLYMILKKNNPTDEMFKEIKSSDDLISGLDLKARENKIKDIYLKIPNQFVPKFDFQVTDNSIFSQDQIKDKITVIYYWRGVEEYNLRNLKNIQKVSEEYKKDKNIQFFTICDNIPGDNVKDMIIDFMNSNKIFIPTSITKNLSSLKSLELFSIPTLLIIDKKGIIRFKKGGWNNSEDKASDIRFYIDEILKDKSN
jgi:hypothetical protein